MSETAQKSQKCNALNSASKLVSKKHLKLPRIHRVGNQFKGRSISHHPTFEVAQKTKDRKSSERIYPRNALNIVTSLTKYYSTQDEGISKLQILTTRNSTACNELLCLQERMLEVKLKSMINPQKDKLGQFESSLYDVIEKCFADSKKSVDKLMNKYSSCSVSKPFVVSTI